MKKTILTTSMAVAISLTLAACGGSAATSDNSGAAAQDGAATEQVEQKGNNWMSADELQATLESKFGYETSNLTSVEDENKKTHELTTNNEDGTVKDSVDINYDGATNEISFIVWHYSMKDTDIDYWMDRLSVVVTNPDDQQILKDTLSEIEDMEMRDLELSDSSLHVFRSGEEDGYPLMQVSISRGE